MTRIKTRNSMEGARILYNTSRDEPEGRVLMRKVMFSVIALLFALLLASPARAQHTPRGTAGAVRQAENGPAVPKTGTPAVIATQRRASTNNTEYHTAHAAV